MSAPKPSAVRYERKFVVHDRSLAEVLALIRLHPAMFREVYPPRAINNIYLDTPTLADYRAHVSGAAHRLKTRIRWYGALQGEATRPALEQKFKHGVVGSKSAHPLPALYVNGGIQKSSLRALLDRAELPELLRSKLRHMEPALLNRYQRRYFVSADGRYRLTADSDLEFYMPHENAGRHAGPPGRRNQEVILELKFAPKDADGATRVANALPFRLTRCSKYVLGIERLHAFQ